MDTKNEYDVQETAQQDKTEATGLETITLEELMQKSFPPREWIVKNLIPFGLTILFGLQKSGKSWLMYALVLAISLDGKFLKYFEVKKTSVLYLALEDKQEDAQERVKTILKEQKTISCENKLNIATECKNGLSGLEIYLKKHRDIKLVIIDPLIKLLPNIGNINEYAQVYEATSKIKDIADDLNIAIIALLHARKESNNENHWMDKIIGSQAFAASADTVIFLQRDTDKTTKENKNTGKLCITGRRTKDASYNLEFSQEFGIWSVIEKKAEPGTKKTSDKTQKNNTASKTHTRYKTNEAEINLLGQ